MDPEQNQTLCSVCARINIGEYFQRSINSCSDESGFVGATKEAIKLGGLSDIIRKSNHCSFCEIVVHAICKKFYRSKIEPNAMRELHKDFNSQTNCWMYSYLYAWDDSPGTSLRKAYRIGIAMRICDEEHCKPQDHAGDIQLLSEDAARVCGSKLFYGRTINPDKFDVTLAKHWIQCCDSEHGRLCNSPLSITDEEFCEIKPRELLVIDVKRQCLKYLPLGTRYIVLSYCWPQTESFTLIQSNLYDLLQPGSLARKLDKLPQTIQDAIHFVHEISETFLWIDALCIIQDSDDHKKSQISQMDRIYGSAYLTLVSAKTTFDPAEACNGLPSYRNSTRDKEQKIVSVRDIRLLVPFESLISLSMSTRWRTRGWTYQELLLSRRLLFFTGTQVYFQCSCNVFCEDGIAEGTSPSSSVSPASNLWNPGGLYSSTEDGLIFGSLHLRWQNFEYDAGAVRQYGQCVEEYTIRNLSRSSDILRAFQGVANIMEAKMRTNFWYGMPEKYLDYCLLWISVGEQKRRRIFMPDERDQTIHYPSWSWVGWDNSVAYGNCNFQENLGREVRWFLVNSREEAIPLESSTLVQESTVLQHDRLSFDLFKPPPNYIHLMERSEVDHKDPLWANARLLACWALLAEFHLRGDKTESEQDSNWPSRDNLAITDHLGTCVGSVPVDKAWSREHLPKTVDFMLISRCQDAFSPYTPDLQYFDNERCLQKPGCLLNVMLIERNGDHRTRVSVGVIHEDAWAAANLRTCFIILS